MTKEVRALWGLWAIVVGIAFMLGTCVGIIHHRGLKCDRWCTDISRDFKDVSDLQACLGACEAAE